MKLRFLTATLSLLGTSAAFAGSVTSGGGRFVGTEYNPWFLENVQAVTYCVDVDPAAFRPGAAVAKSAVRATIDHWKTTFAERMLKDRWYNPGELVPYGDVRLATQTFVEVDCGNADLDLRFQFGRLTPDQVQYLPDFKDYIGVTVRTDYDLRNLRGKGFIYIAADAGPNRPSDPDFARDPWSVDQNIVLKGVLRHELGHLFGLRHESGFSGIMADALIDLLVQQTTVDAIQQNPGLATSWLGDASLVFNYDVNMVKTDCDQYGAARLKDLLLLDDGTRCVRLRFSHNDTGRNELRIKVLSAPSENGPYLEEGTIVSDQGFNGSAEPFIEMKVSDEQQVFSRLPTDVRAHRLTAAYERVTQRMFTGTYTNDAGQVVEHLFGDIDPQGHFRLSAFRNGRLELNFYVE